MGLRSTLKGSFVNCSREFYLQYLTDLPSLRKRPTFRNATIGFSGEVTSEERTQKFHADGASSPRSCLSDASDFQKGTHP